MLKLIVPPVPAEQVAVIKARGSRVDLEAVTATIEGLWSAPLSQQGRDPLTFTIDKTVNVTDPTDVYDQVEIVVTGRIVKDGHRWVVGDGIAISLTSVLAELKALHQQL